MKILLLTFISVQLWQAQVTSKPASMPCQLAAPPKKEENNTQSNVSNIMRRTLMNNGTGKDKIIERSYRRASVTWSTENPDIVKVHMKFTQKAALKYGLHTRQAKRFATTTTKVYLDNDCEYVNYYCMKGFYTGRICARTIYNTYETFKDYCELEYINCMESYEMWKLAHMGACYNISSFNFFAYYAYAVWDGLQLEDLYVLPSK